MMAAEDVRAGPKSIGLFQGFGVEIEYMIVDRESLDVRPVADRLMELVAGEAVADVERGPLAWSNELVLHVLEIKTNGPASSLRGLSGLFASSVREANEALASLDALLLPGGAHPWMDPERETRLWPHEYNDVYRAFDRIFSCRGHGWANLQATHLNLPFDGEDEFRALHSALRAVLPLIPALAASTPILDGRVTGALDQRMVEYRRNSRRVPSVSGHVVPEAVESSLEYASAILEPIYRDLAPLDPAGTLRHEWVNARGAIARFDRGAIEVRVIDAQECPAADLAVIGVVERIVRDLCVRILDGDDRAHNLATEELAQLLDRVCRSAERAAPPSAEHLAALGLAGDRCESVGEVWSRLVERCPPDWVETDEGGRDPVALILERGPLARRILDRVGSDPDRDTLTAAYRELVGCLGDNRVYEGA